MTDNERQLLNDTARRAQEIHRALFRGSADGQPPMMERIATVVIAAERGSWGIKWSVRILLAAGALMGAFAAFRGGWHK